MNINLALAYVATLTGSPETVMDWRAIHDNDKGRQAENFRGTVAQLFDTLTQWNNAGYGIFAMVNQTDGFGRLNQNVNLIRSNFGDLDNSAHGLQRAAEWPVKPSFYVNTSPGKYHVHWAIEPHNDHALFEDVQRRIVTALQADPKCIDPARVLRVPGFYHRKADPFLVTCASIGGARVSSPVLAMSFAAYPPFGGFSAAGTRKPLGDPALQAPSLELVWQAMGMIDPNELDRGEWVSLTAAFKQAMWNLTNEEHAFQIWSAWCARYTHNNPAENLKQWNSIRDTERGWPGIVSRAGLLPYLKLAPTVAAQQPIGAQLDVSQYIGGASDILDAAQQQQYFKGCVLIAGDGRVRTPDGIFMTSEKFNAAYGGPRFIHTLDGKLTDEAWKAVTRNQCWKIPVVHYARFQPWLEPNIVTKDEFGRLAVNSYIRPEIATMDGDPTPFLEHVAKLIPDVRDREILFDYMSFCVQRVGVKIPWCPVIQSVEGGGKESFKIVMAHALGQDYVYSPRMEQLAETSGQFNQWLEQKLFIVADEIRVGERFHLMDVLKPLISQREVETEGKGGNQRKSDNPANWMMFTNFKDAVIVNDSSRRYFIIFSPLQTVEQLLAQGMNEAYFTKLYSWLERDGRKIVTKWLQNRPISPAFQFARAPRSSSMAEAVDISKSSLQVVIESAVAENVAGFRNGWISTKAVAMLAGESGIKCEAKTLARLLQQMGYYKIGQTWTGLDRGASLWHKDASIKTTFTYATDQFLNSGNEAA